MTVIHQHPLDKKKTLFQHNLHFIRSYILGATQQQFADLLGWTRNIVNSLEIGVSKPSYEQAAILKDKTGVDLNLMHSLPLTWDSFEDFFDSEESSTKIEYLREQLP
jgi:transcriptional regulator with XRE-family HTH domain